MLKGPKNQGSSTLIKAWLCAMMMQWFNTWIKLLFTNNYGSDGNFRTHGNNKKS